MPPKKPKKSADKSAAKPPGKAPVKKGVMAPLAKQWKTPALKTKPDSWT
jgi:hypothetical protein